MDRTCAYHPKAKAIEVCAKCNKPICKLDVNILAVSKPGFCARIPLCPNCFSLVSQ